MESNDCQFKVKSKNGAYVMEGNHAPMLSGCTNSVLVVAANASDAKSWARAVQISIRVAKARKEKEAKERWQAKKASV